MTISLDEIRRRIVVALFTDDDLMDQLVLKGGNALQLIHKVSERATIDIDFSMSSDFPDLEIAREKILTVLSREFGKVDLVVFDFSVEQKPPELYSHQPEWWGGYLINFKLCASSIYEEFADDLETIRRRSEVVGPQNKKIFKIDISKHEYCDTKEAAELDDYTVYAYSLPMIVIEKLRAICQQMEPYPHTNHKRPRPRDFFDIYQILKQHPMDLSTPENEMLAKSIFEAKEVPLSFLLDVGNEKDFHAGDWESVELSVEGSIEAFDYYFESVIGLIDDLKSSWKI